MRGSLRPTRLGMLSNGTLISCFFPSPLVSDSLSSLALPSLAAAPTARPAAPFRHVFAQSFSGAEHPPGMPMPAPSLSFCCARRSAPNPNKTISVFGSDPVTIYYYLLNNFDFVCKKLSGFLACNQETSGGFATMSWCTIESDPGEFSRYASWSIPISIFFPCNFQVMGGCVWCSNALVAL